MRNIFLQYYNDYGYGLVEQSQTMNFDLQLFFLHLDQTNDWISMNKDKGFVYIWNSSDIKSQEDKSFVSLEQKNKYDRAYDLYWSKRSKDIPVLEISEQNYDQLVAQWECAQYDKKNFIVLSIHDDGSVTLVAKDTLSEHDKKNIEKEHKLYLDYRKKWEAYKPFRQVKHKEWSSPADEEYYSDFLTDEEIVWKKKHH